MGRSGHPDHQPGVAATILLATHRHGRHANGDESREPRRRSTSRRQRRKPNRPRQHRRSTAGPAPGVRVTKRSVTESSPTPSTTTAGRDVLSNGTTVSQARAGLCKHLGRHDDGERQDSGAWRGSTSSSSQERSCDSSGLAKATYLDFATVMVSGSKARASARHSAVLPRRRRHRDAHEHHDRRHVRFSNCVTVQEQQSFLPTRSPSPRLRATTTRPTPGSTASSTAPGSPSRSSSSAGAPTAWTMRTTQQHGRGRSTPRSHHPTATWRSR